MKDKLTHAIIELYHTSRIALAGTVPSQFDRMQYVKKELHRTYPELVDGMSGKKIWFEIEDAIAIC